MRSQSYMTRALRSSDPRYLHILTKLGYVATSPPFVPAPMPDPPPVVEPPVDEDEDDDGPPDDLGQQLKAAREQYERVTGKRPYHGWDVAELARRIADFHRGNE